MGRIKAIETHFRGCKFRSRLEARWAVFFDTMNIAWQYEPQGYVTSVGPWLPDFWLPDLLTVFEVQADRPTGKEIGALYDVVEMIEVPRFKWVTGSIAWGDFPDGDMALRHHHAYLQRGERGCLAIDSEGLRESQWLQCPTCLRCEIGDHDSRCPECEIVTGGAHETLQLTKHIANGYSTARSARFEHGEKG